MTGYRRMMTTAGRVLITLVWLMSSSGHAGASEQICPLPDQKPMLTIQLFLGQTFGDHGVVSEQAWRQFLRDAVTPRFPHGFTVYDADGQWMDPATHTIGREKTKVLLIAAEDTEKSRTEIGELSELYRAQFKQHSVGILTNSSCGFF